MQEPSPNNSINTPEGLLELISDISREVLRAQPEDIYPFIAKYLDSLLHVRDTITAHTLCNSTCICQFRSILEEELRKIGLNDEDYVVAREIIQYYLENKKGKETSLLSKLSRTLNIEPAQVEALHEMVQRTLSRRLQACAMLEDDNAVFNRKHGASNVSVSSLAGSYVKLPEFKPYSVHESKSNTGDTPTVQYVTNENEEVSEHSAKFRQDVSLYINENDIYVEEWIHSSFDVGSDAESVPTDAADTARSLEDDDDNKGNICEAAEY